jgi:hypothetical protein
MGVRLKRLLLPSIFLLLAFQWSGAGAMEETKQKTAIGCVEDIVLLPWGIRLPARIDTGASQSSIGVEDIRVDGDTVEFRLPRKYGGALLRVPMKGRRNVRSADGFERRIVVEMGLCIGNKRLTTTVNLAYDRSRMDYPLLIGRNVLVDGFVVDVSHSHLLPPRCAESAPR